eukprot:scaffold40890_cov66-Phaeocystis_antarctica.AAC.6
MSLYTHAIRQPTTSDARGVRSPQVPAKPAALFSLRRSEEVANATMRHLKRSMLKVHLWQCPSCAPVPPRGAPDGTRQLVNPRKRPAL